MTTNGTFIFKARLPPAKGPEKMLLILLLVLLQLVFTVSLNIPLNSIEKITLGSRLLNIQKQTKEKFSIFKKAEATNNESTNVPSKDVILIFPGAGGPDQFTEELERNLDENLNGGEIIANFESQSSADTDDSPFSKLLSLFGQNGPNSDEKKASTATTSSSQTNTIVQTMDWQQFRGSVLTAAYDGEAFGETIGDILWKESNKIHLDTESLKSVHCIGISVGAFAANACARQLNHLRQQNTNTNTNTNTGETKEPYLRLTLLDPFTSRGITGSDYGPRYFGKTADYAEQYLNTDDPVPTTNEPLPLCACWDVTGAKERNDFILPEGETMHCWPLVYFARYGFNGKKKDFVMVDNDNDGVGVGIGVGWSMGSVGRLLVHGEDECPRRGFVLSVE